MAAAKREFLKIALTAAGIPSPRFEPYHADTPARSRLARFPLPQCTSCWEAGLAARTLARHRGLTLSIRRRIAEIERRVLKLRVRAPSTPDNGAAFTRLLRQAAPLLEEWSNLQRQATVPAYHWWMPHASSDIGPSKFAAQTRLRDEIRALARERAAERRMFFGDAVKEIKQELGVLHKALPTAPTALQEMTAQVRAARRDYSGH